MHLTLLSLTAECPGQEMDIAFLIDGSGSIERSDFIQMKDFVKALMGQLSSTSTLVSTGHCGLWQVDTDAGRRPSTAGGGGDPVEEIVAGLSPEQCASSGPI